MDLKTKIIGSETKIQYHVYLSFSLQRFDCTSNHWNHSSTSSMSKLIVWRKTWRKLRISLLWWIQNQLFHPVC